MCVCVREIERDGERRGGEERRRDKRGKGEAAERDREAPRTKHNFPFVGSKETNNAELERIDCSWKLLIITHADPGSGVEAPTRAPPPEGRIKH